MRTRLFIPRCLSGTAFRDHLFDRSPVLRVRDTCACTRISIEHRSLLSVLLYTWNAHAPFVICVFRGRGEKKTRFRRRQGISPRQRGRNTPVDFEVSRPCRERGGTGELALTVCLSSSVLPVVRFFLRWPADYRPEFIAAKMQQAVGMNSERQCVNLLG